MEFTGRIYKVIEPVTGTTRDGNPWKRQDFIFEYFERDTDRWSDKVCLSVMNEAIEKYDLHEGDEVRIGFGHSVREWQGRHFNELRLYKLEKLKMAATDTPPVQEVQEGKTADTAPINPKTERTDDDGMPF